MRGLLLTLVGVISIGSAVAAPAPSGDAPPAPGAGSGSAPDPTPPVQEIAPDEPVPAPRPTEPAVVAPSTVHTMDEVTVPRTNLRFGINFFGDTSFVATTPSKPHSSFALGALGVRMLGDLSAHVDALAEFVLETTEAGAASDVEQLAVRWRRGPGLLEVGRFHTEIGYWNTAYHHGLWLQTPIERPHVTRFEDDGGLIPAHWVGVHYTVQEKLGDGALAVITGIANGRGTILDDVRVVGDNNEAKAALLKVRFKGPSLEVGASVIYDRIGPASSTVRPALPGQPIDEMIGNAYLALRGTGVLAIGEGYVFRHQASSDSWMTYAGYGVLGYAVTEWLTPYVAIDLIRGADKDPFFTPVPGMSERHDLTEVLGGARFETSTWSAVKLELRLTRMPSIADEKALIANWSFGL